MDMTVLKTAVVKTTTGAIPTRVQLLYERAEIEALEIGYSEDPSQRGCPNQFELGA